MLKRVEINTFSVARISSEPNLRAITTIVAMQGMDTSRINTFIATSPNDGNIQFVNAYTIIAMMDGTNNNLLKERRKICGLRSIPFTEVEANIAPM